MSAQILNFRQNEKKVTGPRTLAQDAETVLLEESPEDAAAGKPHFVCDFSDKEALADGLKLLLFSIQKVCACFGGGWVLGVELFEVLV